MHPNSLLKMILRNLPMTFSLISIYILDYNFLKPSGIKLQRNMGFVVYVPRGHVSSENSIIVKEKEIGFWRKIIVLAVNEK